MTYSFPFDVRIDHVCGWRNSRKEEEPQRLKKFEIQLKTDAIFSQFLSIEVFVQWFLNSCISDMLLEAHVIPVSQSLVKFVSFAKL